ncbi:relaxase/mobilization nuclease domain-containing protein [Williamsia soli]|uniref:relaxase/mobilization nuclease domain-containing protein n=1 Tax=Williamsia soli TaxID=364929 RepID=UPI001A9CFD1F|nr:relaxase [Williamsia soli]
MIPNIETGAKMTGLVMYLAGPGRANEHANPHIVAASTPSLSLVGGAGVELSHDTALELAGELDAARLVFGTEVSRRDKGALAAAQERGLRGSAAIAEATKDENVWHCSLSLSPEETEALTGEGASEQGLSDAQWQKISEQFMARMGFDSDGDAPARWVAVRHGLTKAGGDHIHIAASRVRDDGSVVKLWFPEPGEDRPRGDKWRAQNVCVALEEEHGLRITAGRAKSYPSKGTSPAQQNIADRTGRAEPAKQTLARRVRGVAAAADSEAEFVRMARANGLLVRPRYAAGSKTDVVGYSVALPTDNYATRDGRPVWHGGGKLGVDLTLPRLREHWAAPDDGARADAVSAWAHNHREQIDPHRSPASSPAAGTDKRAASPPRRLNAAQAKERLRAAVAKVATASPTEDAFVSAAYTHPDLLIRPRFAAGSTDKVVGYSVALRPSVYAAADGKPMWHGGGKLDNTLSLTALRKRWPRTGVQEQMAGHAWQRAAGRAQDAERVGASTSTTAGSEYFDAHRTAREWRDRVNGLNDTGGSDRAWTRAARETAGVMSAWAITAEGNRPAELSRMADALATSSGERRPRHADGKHAASMMRRSAAMILAASHDDPRYAWMAMFAQLAATARAISDALETQGQGRRAQELRAATVAASGRYETIADSARGDGLRIARTTAPQRAGAPGPGRNATTVRSAPGQPSSRDDDLGR